MTRRTAERGVWLIERRHAVRDYRIATEQGFFESAKVARGWIETLKSSRPGWTHRAVRYIPAAPKPSRAKRRKKRP